MYLELAYWNSIKEIIKRMVNSMRVNILNTAFDEYGDIALIKEKSFNCPEVTKRINDAEDVYLLALRAFRMNVLTEEYLYMLCLNAKNDVISVFEISHGSINMTIANPREIFQKALLANAYSIILIHNHPSGDPTPSMDDINNKKRIKEAGDILGIKLLDSLVIGNKTYQSLMNIK